MLFSDVLKNWSKVSDIPKESKQTGAQFYFPESWVHADV
jgi:hypothetical protein